ncbi:glucoside xylosyltransferase 2-like isoform X1 [Dermacentor variabilis]|uniref:glucoside xylosyltransferase 2-like isoform X1 n=2 Tax=Dermacentor variabilis TaxID=34621 RepID=UPI003F5CAAB7
MRGALLSLLSSSQRSSDFKKATAFLNCRTTAIMADTRLAHLLLGLCALAAFAGFILTRFGCMIVDDKLHQYRNKAEVKVQDSVAFNDVTLVKPTASERMTLVFVICESHFDLGIVAVKSAVAYSTSRLHLVIITDKQNEEKIRNEYSSWPDSVRKRVSCEVKLEWFPKDNYHEWRYMFRPCTTQRLFLPSMLPNEDAVIYVDTDVVFLHPVEDFWRKFYAMNKWQMAGMAPETENFTQNYYLKKALHPFVQPFALNAGLLMMNLTRMRAFGLERRVLELKREFQGRIPWADQDLLNILFYRYPQGIFTFTCRWNFRGEHCHGDALCTDGPVAVVHASRKMILEKLEPAFVVLHQAMQKFKFGQSLVDGFIVPVREGLQKARPTGCTEELTKQLPLLTLSASRVDNVTGRAVGANTT